MYLLRNFAEKKGQRQSYNKASKQHLKQLQNEVSLVANLSVMDIMRGTYQWVIQKPEIQAMIDDAARKLNLDKAIVVTQQTKEQLLQLHGLTGKIVALWLSVKNPPRRIIWLVPVLALVIVPFLISGLLQFALARSY